MAGLVQAIFGGQQQQPYGIIQNTNQPGNQPTPPQDPVTGDNAAATEAARQQRAQQAAAVGRGATILTDYALASTTAPTLKRTLGGS
jgi:hypothetical protein